MPSRVVAPRHCQLMAPAADPLEFIESSIYWYPLLFPTRTEVLDHTLLCNGNGYEWGEDGNLHSVFAHIDPAGDDRLDRREQEAAEAEAKGIEEGRSWAAYLREEIERLSVIRADYAHLARTYGPVRVQEQRPGSVERQARTIDSEYLARWTLMGRVPANVTPAWAAVVEEARDLFAPILVEQGRLF